MADQLIIYKGSEAIGTLVRGERELSFEYAPETITRHEGQVVLSASMRVRRRPFSEQELMPFFEGLLPEDFARKKLADRFRMNFSDTFGLLRELGRDSAGALVILPPEINPPTATDHRVNWLSGEELAVLIDQLAINPLGIDPVLDVRLSLAGAQDKVVVVIEGDKIGRPQGTTPSTHILKPSPRERYEGLVLNEAYCLKLASLAGIEVAEADIIEIAGATVLSVRRFDRTSEGEGLVRRIHQEDFCQALHVPTDRKYQSKGGPDLRRMLYLIERISSDPSNDTDRLLDMVAMNFLIGNCDGHAKNFSILYDQEFRLAPAYDIVSTEIYPVLPREMGQSIGGEYRPEFIQPEHWLRELERLNLSAERYGVRLADLAERLNAAIPAADDWLQERGYWMDDLGSIADRVATRANVLSGLKNLAFRGHGVG